MELFNLRIKLYNQLKHVRCILRAKLGSRLEQQYGLEVVRIIIYPSNHPQFSQIGTTNKLFLLQNVMYWCKDKHLIYFKPAKELPKSSKSLINLFQTNRDDFCDKTKLKTCCMFIWALDCHFNCDYSKCFCLLNATLRMSLCNTVPVRNWNATATERKRSYCPYHQSLQTAHNLFTFLH